MLHKKILAEAKSLSDSVKFQWENPEELTRLIKVKLNAASLVLTGIKQLEDCHRLFLAQCFADTAMLAGEDVNNKPLEKKLEYLQVAIQQLGAITKVTPEISAQRKKISDEINVIDTRISTHKATVFGSPKKQESTQFSVASKNFVCKAGI